MNNSVFLDGDWCWDSHPFQINEETKRMVIDNICYLINNFLHCFVYENIIFCWVMHEQAIIDSIIERIDTKYCNIKCISLIADENHLYSRLLKDISQGIRSMDSIEKSMERISMYDKLNTIKIDTNNKTIQEIVDEVKKL